MDGRRGEPRRRAILEATVRIIGAKGPGAVTHRAIAAEAGVPLAATTYYFASKDELLEQALRYAGQGDVLDLRRLAAKLLPDSLTPEDIARVIARYIAEQVGRHRSTVIAQYELVLESARRRSLRAAMREEFEAVTTLFEPMLREAGSRDPHTDANLLVAAMDGMILAELSTSAGSSRRFEAEILIPGLERLLRALTIGWGQAQEGPPKAIGSRSSGTRTRREAIGRRDATPRRSS